MNYTEYREYLKTINEGDVIVHKVISRAYGDRSLATIKVVKLTKTQIVCDNGKRYNREKGTVVGGGYETFPVRCTKEDIQTINAEIKHRNLIYKVLQFDRDKLKLLSTEDLTQILALMEGVQ